MIRTPAGGGNARIQSREGVLGNFPYFDTRNENAYLYIVRVDWLNIKDNTRVYYDNYIISVKEI